MQKVRADVCYFFAQKLLNGFEFWIHWYLMKDTFYPGITFPWVNFQVTHGRSRWQQASMYYDILEELTHPPGWYGGYFYSF